MQADDMDLVRQFAQSGSGEVFAALVQRHVNLVYSVAWRQLGNPHDAEEVAQAVFIILARKAASLREGTILSGWLYQTARLTSANFQRAASRRRHREQEAFMQFTENSDPDVSWQRLSPLLEEAMTRLGQKERDAVVLRFFENRTVREVAAALGLEEAAAQKRVNRATEKLRAFFVRRGVQVSAVTLLASLGTHAVQAAPAELAAKLAATAALKGTAAGGSTLTLIKTTLKIMAWTNTKTAIVIGVGILLAAGTTTMTIKTVSHQNEESLWDKMMHANLQDLQSAPEGVDLRPSKLTRDVAGMHEGYGKVLGLYQPFETLIARAYNVSPWRVLALSPLPTGEFDYMATTSSRQRESLQDMIKAKFGLKGRHEMRETDVLESKMKRPNATGLKPNSTYEQNSSSTAGIGSLHRVNGPMSYLAFDLEHCLQIPVIDRTGLAGRFDYDVKWDDELKWDDTGRSHFSNLDGLKQALLDQLGLELVPARETLDMLVVEKAN
jgi:uncharacterized protein (TIGR03435 family)